MTAMTTTTHESIEAAIVAAVAEMPAITKGNTANIPTKTGPSYSYRYADLADILDVVRSILAKHGLAVVQDATTPERGGVAVTTRIVWAGGAVMEFGPLAMPAGGGGGGPQAMGSAITYARRYALLAALGIATEDDDGQAAQRATQAHDREAAEVTRGRQLYGALMSWRSSPAVAERLRRFGHDHGKELTIAAFDADPDWAAAVTDELTAAVDAYESTPTPDPEGDPT